jgi:ubiquitin carboxyl-terminal hydrolase 9/24
MFRLLPWNLLTADSPMLPSSDLGISSYLFFQFPWVLDMEPYTEEGMAWREQHESQSEESSDDGSEVILTPGAKATRQINYELVGVVVHSGQANAGHYYSFIKDRK